MPPTQSPTQRSIELRQVKNPTADYDRIEKAIKDALRKVLYDPLLAALNLPVATIANAKRDLLVAAIEEGRLTLSGGRVEGKLNAGLTRELRSRGARWDGKGSAFVFPSGKVPADLSAAAGRSAAAFDRRLEAADRLLQKNLPEEIAEHLQLTKLFDSTIFRVDRELQASLKAIAVAPTLTESARKKIAEEWQGNMDIWITDFAEEEITRLRKSLRAKVFKGNRYEDSIRMIQRSFGVSAAKAKFLARQETSLLVTKLKETRYTDAGVHEYKWRCVAGTPAHPVRPSHKILDGKVFRWDAPPVTTAPDQPVRRNNPGQDFNCRCSAIPVVTFREGQ